MCRSIGSSALFTANTASTMLLINSHTAINPQQPFYILKLILLLECQQSVERASFSVMSLPRLPEFLCPCHTWLSLNPSPTVWESHSQQHSLIQAWAFMVGSVLARHFVSWKEARPRPRPHRKVHDRQCLTAQPCSTWKFWVTYWSNLKSLMHVVRETRQRLPVTNQSLCNRWRDLL